MIRRLGDGTFLDTRTGMLLASTPTQQELMRDTQLRAKGVAPIPSRGQQIETVVQVQREGKAKQVVLQPRTEALAVDPYGTGMQGVGLFPNLSDTAKRYLLTGLLVAAAAGIVFVQTRMGKKD